MKLEQEIQSKFNSEFQRAYLNVVFTANWLMEHWNHMFKEFELSQQQYNVLRILRGQKGKPINLVDIQNRMIHKSSNTTRLVEKLRLKGLVERIQCESNRRKVEISITNEGLKLLDKIDPFLKTTENDLFKNISTKEAKQISDLLDKMRD